MNIQVEFSKAIGNHIYNHKEKRIAELTGCHAEHLTFKDLMFEEKGNYEDWKVIVESEDELTKKQLSYQLCCSVIPAIKLFSVNNKKKINKELFLGKLKSIVYDLTGFTEDEMQDNSTYRKREYVVARQIIMAVYFNADHFITYRESGELFGKDHATALHSCKTINNLIHTDINFFMEWKDVFDFAYPNAKSRKDIHLYYEKRI